MRYVSKIINIYKIINIWFLKILLCRLQKQTIDFCKIIVITPHPDDEIFGLGGSILKLLYRGTKVSIIFLTDGERSESWSNINEIRCQRILLSDRICDSIGIETKDIIRLHIPDGEVPHPNQPCFNDTVNSLKVIIDEIKPDAIFSTHIMDYWPFDHVAAAHISLEAVKQSKTKPELWYYWVWAWYNTKPWQLIKINSRRLKKVEIDDQLNQKKELIRYYLNSVTLTGVPWIGNIPKPLLSAFQFNFEVVTRVKF